MAIQIKILDPTSGREARITEGGALSVSPVSASRSFNATLSVDDTVVNIIKAKAYNNFYITGALLAADQGVSNTTSAIVSIYVGDSGSTSLVDSIDTLLTIPLSRNDTRDITGIYVKAPKGKWINGVTTDNSVFVTILGYYLPEEPA